MSRFQKMSKGIKYENRCRSESSQSQTTGMGYHLTLPLELHTVMVSYADFHQSPTRRRRAIEEGLHTSLDIPKHEKSTWIMEHSGFHVLGAKCRVMIIRHS